METLTLDNIELEELEVFIKDGDGEYGYGFVYHNGEHYIGEQYQSRIDMAALIKDNHVGDLMQESKLYNADCETAVGAIEEILSFWWNLDSVTDNETVHIINNYSDIPSLLDKCGKDYVIVIKK